MRYASGEEPRAGDVVVFHLAPEAGQMTALGVEGDMIRVGPSLIAPIARCRLIRLAEPTEKGTAHERA